MDNATKASMIRGIMNVFPEFDSYHTPYTENEKISEVAVAAIRGIVTVDDAPPPKLPAATAKEFVDAMGCRKIQAIKVLREITGQGLKESKDAVEALMKVFADAAVLGREPMPF